MAANTRQPVSSAHTDAILHASELVQDVTYRLRTGSHKLCSTYVTHDAGLSYMNSAMLDRIGLLGSAAQFGTGNQLSVFHVVPDSAADLAGVKDGDVIENISSAEIAEGTLGKGSLKANLDQSVKSGKPFTLTLRRGQDQIQALIEPEPACDFQVALMVQGDSCCSIFVWREFAQNKEPIWYFFEDGLESDPMLAEGTLALYISHHAAHALMGHPEQLAKARDIKASIGTPSATTIFGPATGNIGSLTPPFNQKTENDMRNEFEPKADLLSLYMLAESGYGTGVAISSLGKLAGPKGSPNFPQLHVFTGPEESWRNINQLSQRRDKLTTEPLNKANRLTKMRFSRIGAEASRIDEKLKNGTPVTENATELQRIIYEIANTRIQEPENTGEPPKLPVNYQFGEPFMH